MFAIPQKRLHYSVVIVTACIILLLYYAFKYSLPTPSEHYLGWFWNTFYFEFGNNIIGILLNVPILYATITLGWKRSLIIVSVLSVSIAPYILTFAYNLNTIFVSFGFLIIPALIIIVSEIKIISNTKERMAELEKKRERTEYMRQLFSIQEIERKRISQELHDAIIQTLLVNASLAYNLLGNSKISSDTIKTDLENIKNNSLSMVVEIRRICQDLRPSVLDNLGLVSSIKWLIDIFHEETGVNVEFSLNGSVYELTTDESAALFRIVQETLNNIKRHAEANLVHVSIGFLESCMSVKIKDNGKGFKFPDNINRLALCGKLGILGMNERAQSIGAVLQIKSVKGSGTEIDISIQRKN